VDVGAGLLQRQRQQAQQLSDLSGGVLVGAAGAGQQERGRLGRAEHPQVGQAGMTIPGRVPGGDQDLAVHHPGQQVHHPGQRGGQAARGVWRLGVVEYQQPAVVALQPAAHPGGGALLVGLGCRVEVERSCQVGIVAYQGRGLLCADPPHHLEADAMPPGVLHRQRGLADPTPTLQHLGDRDRTTAFEPAGKPGEDLVAAGEARVAREGDVPNRRQRGRESGPVHRRRRWRSGEPRSGVGAAVAA
jgi:hypothetical protein